MKKNVFLTIVLVVSVNTVVFSQAVVSVPDRFVGTWWIDMSEETDMPDGIQALAAIEIKKNGIWISSVKFVSYSQEGRKILAETGLPEDESIEIESGDITRVGPNEIVLSNTGQADEYDNLKIDGNDLIDIQKRRFVKVEPRKRWQ
jgi:hypothetical protein